MGEWSEMMGLPNVMEQIVNRMPGGTLITNEEIRTDVGTVYEQRHKTGKQNKINIMDTEKKEQGIILPTEIRKATAEVPRTLCIYGKPKVGKTTILSELPNNLIIDTEKGSAFINGLIMEPPEGAGPVSIRNWLKEVAKTIKDAGRPYDYVSIDTLSQLDIWSEWWGTWDYMHSIPGKKFNKKLDERDNVILGPDKKPILLSPNDPEYQSVLTLGQGYGYQYTRSAFIEMFEILKDLGKVCTIFTSHVADKMIGEKNGEQVMVKDVALTGKLRDWLPRIVDAVGHVWNEDGQMMVSFKAPEDRIGGIRGKHLPGYTGKLDWNFIFQTDKNK